MNKKTNWFLLLLVVGITFASCKKEDPIPPAPTNAELLTKIWKVDQVLLGTVDVTFFYTGSRFNFRADNTVILTAPGETPDTSNWAFNDAQTQVILTQAGARDTLNILALTSTQFKIRSYDYDEEIESTITMSPAP